MIPYGKHQIDQQDIDAISHVLTHEFLTQGQQVPAFEQELQQYCQSQFSVAVNSGTSALHIACLAAGVTKGDVVWTSPISFVASANCALYCGAEIDFVDIDPATRNLSIEALTQKLATATKIPKAIVVVHYAGVSCDMEALAKLKAQYGFFLIEDACHALGGKYQNFPIGSCQYSDMAVLSFHPVKSITTAEGGAVTTNNAELAEKLALFAKHGITRDPARMENPSEDTWYYEQVELGYNYRLSDLHAALGRSQLKKLDGFIAERQKKVDWYQQALAHFPLKLPTNPESGLAAWHIYVVECIKHDRQTLFNRLREKGIGVNVHYIPIHLQPYYSRLGFNAGDFPVAESFYKNAITLPLYPGLEPEQQQRVVDALDSILA